MTLNDFLDEWNNPKNTVEVQTSGSTGVPKCIRVEKQRMLNSARITCDFLGLKAGDTALLCMPLDYIAGKMVVVRSIERQLRLTTVEASGHPLKNITNSFDFAAMVPMQVYNSLQVAEEREKLRTIKHLIIGGGPINDDLQQQLSRFPNNVWSTYGMTETLSHIALRRLNGENASLWYTPFNTVSISLNTNGCLVIEAPLVHEGRLETHDRAEIRDGKFRILGRLDNVINSGGIKIQAEEVEEMLRPHIKMPYLISKCRDEKFGEVVVLLTECPDLSFVKEICCDILPKFWQPKHYLYTSHIPLTGTGKPARKAAEEWCSMQLRG
ncbi:MAG: AMP-binding protein [Prevotella sp.]|nr:AMP-binding protein [Prevotella sp.]